MRSYTVFSVLAVFPVRTVSAVRSLKDGKGNEIGPGPTGVAPLDITVGCLKLHLSAVLTVGAVLALVAGEIVKGSQIAPGLFALIGVLPLDMGIGAAQLYLPAVLGTGADGGHLQPHQPAGIVGPVVAVILLIEHIQLCTA